MEFVNPVFLYGLLGISIPIIIHLFNFRRYRKEYFSSIHFLKEIKIQKKRKSRLKHLIILLLRILAIASLVIAFAQPYIPLTGNKIKFEEHSAICVFVDNSFSMEAESTEGFLIDEAKKKAENIAGSYKSSDVYQFLNNDFEGKHHRFVTLDDFNQWVSETNLTPAVRPVSDIISRFNDQLAGTEAVNKIIYIVSDFQKSITDIDNINADTNVLIYLVPVLSNNRNNLFIDSCWFETPILQPGHQVKLNVRIKNASDINYEKIPLKLIINGSQRALTSFDINPGETKLLSLPYTIYKSGFHHGRITITDYPVIFDDIYYLTYKIRERIDIMIINNKEESKYLNLLFKNDTAFSITNVFVNNLDYSKLKDNDLIILNQLYEISSGLVQSLIQFIDNAGSLVVFPADHIDYSSYNMFLNSMGANTYLSKVSQRNEVDYINIAQQVFSDVFEEMPENVDLPDVFRYYKLSKKTKVDRDIILEMQSGDVFFSLTNYKGGKLYLSAVALDEKFSNLPKHAIFVPLLYKVALLSDNDRLLSGFIGEDESIVLKNINNNAEEIIKLKKVGSDFEIIPEQLNIKNNLRLLPHNQIDEAGNYLIIKNDEELNSISYNYNRKESLLKCYEIDELKDIIEQNDLSGVQVLDIKGKPVSEVIRDLNKGVCLWKLFIIFALIFLAGEILVIRFWKT